MMRTLFLQAPSFEGFDGGAGARYQNRREIKSFWYPTWLAQPAALVEGSKLIDAPPHRLSLADVLPEVKDRDLVVLHTSTPSFSSDVKTVRALKEANPNLKIGMIGAKVAVDAAGSLQSCPELDFVARNEFDFTIKEVAEGRDLDSIKGLSYRGHDGRIVHNDERQLLHNMDDLPFVSPVYKRDLQIENYFIGYLRHPYLSFYTGRGCKSRCTFCLWPQTVGGHAYRVRSVGHVIEELKYAMKAFPQVKEVFFDDDTLTDNLPRVEELARERTVGNLASIFFRADGSTDGTPELLAAYGDPILHAGPTGAGQLVKLVNNTLFFVGDNRAGFDGLQIWKSDGTAAGTVEVTSLQAGFGVTGIGMDPADALLRAGEPGVQLTWMDVKIHDWVVTPRHGKPVEIQALWLAALGAELLVQVLPEMEMPAFDTYLCYPEQLREAAKLKVFRDFLIAKARTWAF